MPPRSLFLARAIRYGLLSAGSSALISGGVNLYAAFQLIDSSAEQSLGLTRQEVIAWCCASIVAGGLLLFLGIRRKA